MNIDPNLGAVSKNKAAAELAQLKSEDPYYFEIAIHSNHLLDCLFVVQKSLQKLN